MRTESPGGHRQKGRHATHKKQTTAPRLGTPPGRNQQATNVKPPARKSTRGAIKRHKVEPEKLDVKPKEERDEAKSPPAAAADRPIGWSFWLAIGGLVGGGLYVARSIARRL